MVRLVVLYTSGAEPDWPDALDPYTGAFTYFGDNRSPGRTLHETPRKGNLLLDAVFTRVHAGREGRERVPPFLLVSMPSRQACQYRWATGSRCPVISGLLRV